ncbi:hypothetical protein AHAS_Ahas14G0077900 [Arachis hypogaea]
MRNIETVLSNSITVIFFVIFVVAGIRLYGLAITLIKLFDPHSFSMELRILPTKNISTS